MPRKKTTRTPSERREEITRLASSVGLASVPELATRFEVTSSTIRRDLQILADSGKVARTYGGAITITQTDGESSLQQRLCEGAEVKARIASRALQEITSGESVYLDGGSTVGALASLMPGAVEANVMAVGLNSISALASDEKISVSSPGGTIRPRSQTFVGSIAEATIMRQTFNCAFMSADGVSAELGLCEAEQSQAFLKELVSYRSERVYVLADSSKIDRRIFNNWALLPPGWTLITDSSSAEKDLEVFRNYGISVVTV